MSKKNSKPNSESLAMAYELFNLTPDIKLTKKEKKILRAIYEYDDMDFYSLCEWFDMRPSKLDKCLDMLDCYGLIDYMDTEDALVIIPTPLGDRLCGTSKTEKKADKQLRKFLNQLNEDELMDFCEMCTDVLDIEEGVCECPDNCDECKCDQECDKCECDCAETCECDCMGDDEDIEVEIVSEPENNETPSDDEIKF